MEREQIADAAEHERRRRCDTRERRDCVDDRSVAGQRIDSIVHGGAFVGSIEPQRDAITRVGRYVEKRETAVVKIVFANDRNLRSKGVCLPRQIAHDDVEEHVWRRLPWHVEKISGRRIDTGRDAC